MKGIFYENFETSYIPEILKEIYRDRIYAPYLEGKSDLTILDIGANIGLFTMYAYPFAKKIYAVEPSTAHHVVLNKMLNFNNMYDKVEKIQKAIFHEDKKMTFFLSSNTTMHSLSKLVGDTGKTEDVQAVRMDTFFKEHNIEHVDFMKLDIEGAEMEVIGGEGFENVADKIDAMVVEYHDWSGRNPAQLITALNDYGFDVRSIPSDAKLFGAVRR